MSRDDGITYYFNRRPRRTGSDLNRNDLIDPQPAPKPRPGAPSLHDVAAALHIDRRDHGRAKYASLLQTFNGRSATVDRLQEQLDRLVYDIQAVLEVRAVADALTELRRVLEAEAGEAIGGRGYYRGLRTALDEIERLLNPAALAVRADALAAELMAAPDA